MSYKEWQLINRLASQLQHYHDNDLKQSTPEEISALLDKAYECMVYWRPILKKRDISGTPDWTN